MSKVLFYFNTLTSILPKPLPGVCLPSEINECFWKWIASRCRLTSSVVSTQASQTLLVKNKNKRDYSHIYCPSREADSILYVNCHLKERCSVLFPNKRGHCCCVQYHRRVQSVTDRKKTRWLKECWLFHFESLSQCFYNDLSEIRWELLEDKIFTP